MKLAEYGEGCRKTESLVNMAVWAGELGGDRDVEFVAERMINARILHAVMGISTEAAEMMDVLKKHIFYGKDLDREAMVNLLEEAGDACWYLFGILLDELGTALKIDDPINSCLAGNLSKLRKRYGEKFSEFDAAHRDVVAEIKALKQEMA